MKKTLTRLILGVSACIALCYILNLALYLIDLYNPYQQKQEALAKEYGVVIENYPYPELFPIGYFETVLKPGMSAQEVHEVVQGYELVLTCQRVREVYYFFHSEDDKSLRVEIVYDDQGHFVQLRSEDEDSRTIYVVGCKGLLE